MRIYLQAVQIMMLEWTMMVPAVRSEPELGTASLVAYFNGVSVDS
jgi:hypothetical protein